MKVAFVGYMGCGKSFWASKLGAETGLVKYDLDSVLEMQYLYESISDYISRKGEIDFRKKEKLALEQLCLLGEHAILSTGGGTPCYYNNMEVLNNSFFTIYLNVSIQTLVSRLKDNKAQRPLISHLKDEELHEFVAKHLFERRHFYAQANLILNEKDINIKNILAALPK